MERAAASCGLSCGGGEEEEEAAAEAAEAAEAEAAEAMPTRVPGGSAVASPLLVRVRLVPELFLGGGVDGVGGACSFGLTSFFFSCGAALRRLGHSCSS
jgi:hypothetical protein